MAKINLNNKPIDVLEIEIGDKIYKIPLGSSLPLKKAKTIKDEESVMEFLREYMPEKVVDNLTISQLAQIMNAWSEETKRASGISLGES